MENPLARLVQGLKDRDPSLMELINAVDEASGRGGCMMKDPNEYDDYSEFLRTEMIIDEPKFEQFMMRFADMNVRIWNMDGKKWSILNCPRCGNAGPMAS